MMNECGAVSGMRFGWGNQSTQKTCWNAFRKFDKEQAIP
jgi:hypothetical protein